MFEPNSRATIVDWYSNLRYPERSLLHQAFEKSLTPDPYLRENEVFLTYTLLGYPSYELYWDVCWRAWGLVEETEVIGGTVFKKWRVTVPRVTLLSEAFLLAEADLCMPYGKLVNYFNSPVIIPPPC